MDMQYDRDISPMKPKKWARGLTSHCFRAIGMNVLDKHPQIKKSWMENRAGLSRKKIDTTANYCRGTAETDRPCALLLAGWPDPVNGGHCPFVSSLPDNIQSNFRRFASQIFQWYSSALSDDFVAFVAVPQVMWYVKYPDHQYFTSMIALDIVSQMDLMTWSRYLYQAFEVMNQIAFVGRPLPASDSNCDTLPSISTAIASMSYQLDTLTNQVAVLATEAVKNSLFQSEMSMSIGSIQELLIDVKDKLCTPSKKRSKDTIIDRDINGASTSAKRTKQLTQSSLSTGGSAFQPAEKFPASEVHAMPKITSISNVIVHWYVNDLAKFTGMSPDEKSNMKKLCKAMRYFKHFMEPSTDFTKQAGESVSSYTGRIIRIATSVEANITRFLQRPDIFPIWRQAAGENPLKVPSSTHFQKASFWANFKRLEHVEEKLPPISNYILASTSI